MAQRRQNRESGFSLIEVLVAVLVLAIGLLGLAALQASAVRFNHEAQLRSQAAFLAYDIADRMRVNPDPGYNRNSFLDPRPNCDTEFTPDQGQTIAAQDLAEWDNFLACLLPGGEGRVALQLIQDPDDPDEQTIGDVTVRVQWIDRAGDGQRHHFVFRTRL